MPAGSYTYRAKPRKELTRIAKAILDRFPGHRSGWTVDIEAIVEEWGFEIIFRPMRGIPIEAYVARNPRYLVVNEDYIHYEARYRFTLAEELAHRVLEFNLWNNPDATIPPGARVHELTQSQNMAIERNAKCLAAELLQPEDHYRERFEVHSDRLQKLDDETRIKQVVIAMTKEFNVSRHSAAFRARVLGLVKPDVYNRLFPPPL